MTTEEFERRLKEMSNDDIIEKAEQEVSELAQSYGKSFTMHIPPHINDTDMILSEIIRRYKDLLQKSGDLNEKKFKSITPEIYDTFTKAEKEEYCRWLLKQIDVCFDIDGNPVPLNLVFWDGDRYIPTINFYSMGTVLHCIKTESAEEV